jgi:glycosyltransferase EpsF
MIRILHVVESFDGQATEAWLTRLLRLDVFDGVQFEFEFFLTGGTLGKHAGLILELGIAPTLGTARGNSIPQMARALRRHVRNGNYDIVHIHQDVIGGVFALALRGSGITVLTHVHNCWQRLPVGGYVKELVLTRVARLLTLRLSNAIVGVSHQALIGMTSGRSRHGRVDRVIYCSAKVPAIAPDSLARDSAASAMQRRFGLPESVKVLLFLGRLDGYKNPIHALDLLCAMRSHGAMDLHLVIAGLGGLESALRTMALERGVESHVHLVGWVDKPEALLLAADLLIMPSLEISGEGLGLVAVEAQALGTPVLCSQSIPEDAMVIPSLFRRISLSEGIGNWRKVAEEFLEQESPDLMACWDVFQRSPFTDAASYTALASLYEELVATGNGV